MRRGFTLLEVLVALIAGSMLFILILEFHQRGLRVLESDSRKMTAIRRTHITSEKLQQELFSTRWAWSVPLKEPEGGSPLVYAGGLELYFDSAEKKLYCGGDELSGDLAAVQFYAPAPYVLKYALRADEHTGNTRFSAERERSALVGAVYLQQQDEELTFGAMGLAPMPLGFNND